MARGQDGSLFLSCMTLSFTTPRRFIPTLSSQNWLPHGSDFPEGFHVSGRGRCQACQAVAAFQHRDQPAARILVRDFQHESGELGEIGVGESELAERISYPRIEA